MLPLIRAGIREPPEALVASAGPGLPVTRQPSSEQPSNQRVAIFLKMNSKQYRFGEDRSCMKVTTCAWDPVAALQSRSTWARPLFDIGYIVVEAALQCRFHFKTSLP